MSNMWPFTRIDLELIMDFSFLTYFKCNSKVQPWWKKKAFSLTWTWSSFCPYMFISVGDSLYSRLLQAPGCSGGVHPLNPSLDVWSSTRAEDTLSDFGLEAQPITKKQTLQYFMLWICAVLQSQPVHREDREREGADSEGHESTDPWAPQLVTPFFLALTAVSTEEAAGANILTVISTMWRKKPKSHGACLARTHSFSQPVSFLSLLTLLSIVHPPLILDRQLKACRDYCRVVREQP